MGKPNADDSQLFDRTSSPSPLLPPPTDFDMNCQTSLSQSDPSIQYRQNQLINRLTTNTYNASSYKVSIGHETVNITEIARQRETSSDLSNEKRRLINSKKTVNILSLCFMCFVSASLILISLTTMQLISKTNPPNHPDILSHLHPTINHTSTYLYMLTMTETVSNLLLPTYDRIIRELAIVICLLIIVFNCFCVLIFSIEIYLGSNLTRNRQESSRFSSLFGSSSSRFIAICSFYASIPAFLLVMCLFILLNLSLIPAILSFLILGIGLIFILLTLLNYFSIWQNLTIIGGLNSSFYHTINGTHIYDDDIDLTKTDELSTLV